MREPKTATGPGKFAHHYTLHLRFALNLVWLPRHTRATKIAHALKKFRICASHSSQWGLRCRFRKVGLVTVQLSLCSVSLENARGVALLETTQPTLRGQRTGI